MDGRASLGGVTKNKTKRRGNSKTKYNWSQTFQQSWKKSFPWVIQSQKDPSQVFCSVCAKYMRCKKDDLAKHDVGLRHRRKMGSLQPTEPLLVSLSVDEFDSRTEYTNLNLEVRGVDLSSEVGAVITALYSKLRRLREQQQELASITSSGIHLVECDENGQGGPDQSSPLIDAAFLSEAVTQIRASIKLINTFVETCSVR